jgi:hypothetical protein
MNSVFARQQSAATQDALHASSIPLLANKRQELLFSRIRGHLKADLLETLSGRRTRPDAEYFTLAAFSASNHLYSAGKVHPLGSAVSQWPEVTAKALRIDYTQFP